MKKSDPATLDKFANLPAKIRNTLQLSGLAIFAVVYVLTNSGSNVLTSSKSNALAGLGFLLILYCQVVGSIEMIPPRSRAPLLFGCLALALAFVFIARAFDARGASATPQYSPAEQAVVDLRSQIDQIRASYVLLLEQPDKALEVNRDARHLAERLAAVDDTDLNLGIQVYKYEATAYSWAMVTGSEPDSAKLKAIEETLHATDKGQQLIDDVKRSGPYDQHIQHWRDWIINDNAVPRLQRLTAVALCARWELKKNPDDLLKVRQIVQDLPHDYRMDEHTDSSNELRSCLSGKDQNQSQNRGRAALPGKETKQE